MYGCESWTVKKANCWRTDAFELWCWKRLLRVPWTARRSNQSILKEISPESSLEGDWCWSQRSNTLATWCEDLTHLKRPWCWKILKGKGIADHLTSLLRNLYAGQEATVRTGHGSALLTTPKPLTVWITMNCGRFWERWEYRHLTCLLRNLYAGQEATVRTGHGTTDWFQIEKGERQGWILSPYLFNLYAEYMMRNTGLEETQAEIKIAGREEYQ